MNNIKLDFLEKLIFLENIAEKRPASLANEFCLFIRTELNLKGILLAKEISRNQFQIIGKSVGVDYVENLNNSLKINNYDLIQNSFNIDNELITECLINNNLPLPNYQNLVFNFGKNSLGLLIFIHKIKPSSDDLLKYHTVVKVIKKYISRFFQNEIKPDIILGAEDKINKSIKEITKEVNTSNGIISLIKLENTNQSVLNYLNDLKENNLGIQRSLEDLLILINFNNESYYTSETLIDLQTVLKNLIKSFNEKNGTTILVSEAEYQIKTKLKIFESTLSETLKILYSVSNNDEINISQKFENKVLTLSFTTYAPKIDEQIIKTIEEPFNLSKYSYNKKNVCSGISFSLLHHYLQNIKGKFKIESTTDGHFILNIILNVEAEENKNKASVVSLSSEKAKDKVLIVESNSASSVLLKNYLSKWNYEAVFADSGDTALGELKDRNYVAVIVNIEQEKENSLQLIQKLRNNKFSKNIPIIVFLLETDTEKIFLMGTVDYLVKPINYNNLIEILTSYKLSKDSTVLCVDDDLPTLNLLKQAVITSGFNPLAELRSENVMDLIKDKRIDLAIIDLDMPKLNGFDLIKLMKSKDEFINLPIIIYTGTDDYQNDLEKIEGLFVDLLEKKSTSLGELEKTIINFINYNGNSNSSEPKFNKSNGPKILMAEDYKHSQIIVTRLLKKNGFENIIVVENGLDALKICQKEKIDLILMDMQMPIMNGFEATEKIRELSEYHETPIIALTAFAMKGDREKCLEAGATDYIPKPIDSKEFIEKVNYYTQILTNDII